MRRVELGAHFDDFAALQRLAARRGSFADGFELEPNAASPALSARRVGRWCSQTGVALLVALESFDRRNHEARGAARPQLEIGLEEHARRGAGRDPALQAQARRA